MAFSEYRVGRCEAADDRRIAQQVITCSRPFLMLAFFLPDSPSCMIELHGVSIFLGIRPVWIHG